MVGISKEALGTGTSSDLAFTFMHQALWHLLHEMKLQDLETTRERV